MSNASSTEAFTALAQIKDWAPTPLLRNGHLQTFWSTRRRAKVLQKPSLIHIPTQASFTWTGQLYKNKSNAIVILFHGLGGQSNSAYMLETTNALLALGYDVACMALPGNEHRDAYTYHAGDYVYLNALEAYFSADYKNLHWIGFSLGGNIILKWLSTAQPQSMSMAISPVIDLSYGVDQVDSRAFGLYRRHFLTSLSQVVRQKLDLHQKAFLPYASATAVRTLRGFDQAITCPFHGYATTHDYYQANQALHDIKNISTRTVILAAQDDPFSLPVHFTPNALPANVYPVLPRHGGHVGFFEHFATQSMLGPWVTSLFKQQ